MQQLLDHSQQAAGAYQLSLQFGQATQALVNAATAIEAEAKKHPDDRGFHEQWLLAVWAAANARQREGERFVRGREPDFAGSIRQRF